MKTVRNMLVVILTFLLIGCSHELNIAIPDNSPLLLTIHEDSLDALPDKESMLNIKLPKRTTLTGEKREKFRKWVLNNRTGWKAMPPVSVVPEILVEGDGFGFNFSREGGVVVNYSGGQFSKDVKLGEYKFLLD
jgi:hypothetical protein